MKITDNSAELDGDGPKDQIESFGPVYFLNFGLTAEKN